MNTDKEKKTLQSNEEIIDEITKDLKDMTPSEVLFDNDTDAIEDEKEDEKSEKTIEDDDYIDEVYLKDQELTYTPEDLECKRLEAIKYKEEGNKLFKDCKWIEAAAQYTTALRTCPLAFSEDRAILFANRAACKMKMEMNPEGVEDCNRALDLKPKYEKALARRAMLLEKTDKLDEALEDYKKLLELNPSNSEAKNGCQRLPPEINERNEKLKAEMLGSLKELGNKILRPFGLSTNNFQVTQDPNSGGYSINFNKGS